MNFKKNNNTSRLENVAIVGNGGRENALAWAIQKNESIKNIYLIPGNGGSNLINKCKTISLNYADTETFIKKLSELDIDLVIIGPEIPLEMGLGNELRKGNFLVFGPDKDGARLESSKSWAKSFMKDANIPTANFWKATTIEESMKIINASAKPLVVKADGLASGKGVFIPETKNETIFISKEILEGKFGKAGKTIVLEEKISGPEISVFALCDGERYVLLPTAQDHKRIGEGDKGLNTGGMGAYSPTPLISETELQEICEIIVEPTIKELIKRKINYRGVLYFGLMITTSGPKVIEYNCRFGDPECQTIMPLMDKDFVNLLYKCAMGLLKGNEKLSTDKQCSGCVIASSKGYPLDFQIGFPIQLQNTKTNDIQVFHSGTSTNEFGNLITNGGRVLSVVAQGNSFDEVFDKAYSALNEISFEGIFYRKDIGHQVRNIKKENKI